MSFEHDQGVRVIEVGGAVQSSEARAGGPMSPAPAGPGPSALSDQAVQRLSVSNHFPSGEVLRAASAVMLLLLGAYLLWRIQEVLFLMFLAILLATAIEPIVNRLRRGSFTRGTGVLAVYSALIAVLALAALAVVPGLLSEGGAFMDAFPQRLEVLRAQAAALQPAPLRNAVTSGLERIGEILQTPAAPAGDQLVAVGATPYKPSSVL